MERTTNYSLLLLSRSVGWCDVAPGSGRVCRSLASHRGIKRVPVWLFLQKQSDSFHKNSVKEGKVDAGGRKQIKQSQSTKAFKNHNSCVLSCLSLDWGDKNIHPGPQEWTSLKKLKTKGRSETRLGFDMGDWQIWLNKDCRTVWEN